MTIYDNHIHTMLKGHVCVNFLPAKMMILMRSEGGFRAIHFLAKKVLSPFTDHGKWDRAAQFAWTMNFKSQKELFLYVKNQYPEGTIFTILAVDMAYMNAGKVPIPYEDQIKELMELKQKYGNIVKVFMHVDPRRPGIVPKAIEFLKNGGDGIKLYTLMGYPPYHPILYPLFEYCEKNRKPITTHGSPRNPVHLRGSKKFIRREVERLCKRTYRFEKWRDKKDLCSNFTHPRNYQYIIDDFPGIIINIAHYGSAYEWDKLLKGDMNDNWVEQVRAMIRTYKKNIYTDISYTFHDERYWDYLSKDLEDPSLKDNILLGCDFPMTENEKINASKVFSKGIREHLGEEKYTLIAETNPQRFLGEK